jgi:hypothetical protein
MLAPWIDGRRSYLSIYFQEQAFKDLVAAQPRQVFRGSMLCFVERINSLFIPPVGWFYFVFFAFFVVKSLSS